jgi:small subunit ribosomal protein S1
MSTEPNPDPNVNQEPTASAPTTAPPPSAETTTAPEPAPTEAAPSIVAEPVTSETPASPAGDPPKAETTAGNEPAKKIAIGSQRDVADKSPAKPKAVQAAESNPVQLNPSAEPAPVLPVGTVNSTAGLSDDVDAEIEAMLGDIQMDSVIENSEAPAAELEAGTRVKATVTRIHNDDLFVKLPGQDEGVAAFHHFKEEPNIGDEVELTVRGRNAEDGLYELGVPGAAIGVADWADVSEGAVVDAVVTGSNSGGLEVQINTLSGFMPASQIDRFRVGDLAQFVGQKFQAVVMEVKPEKRKLVVSRRAILERENEENRKKLLAELEEGQLRDGTVTKLLDFGAFVDLGGVEGLIHVSKVSWSRVKHPSEVLEVGQKVKVKVEKIGDAGRISLSHRDTLEHPWKSLANEFNVEEVVKGTVTKIADFGAFVRIAPGVEGLVHISELAHHRVSRVSNVVNEGDEIQVKILSMDIESQKMSLSLKATQTAPPKKGKPGDKEPEVEEAPPRELAVKPTGQPLKGGTGRTSGGESVGLNW